MTDALRQQQELGTDIARVLTRYASRLLDVVCCENLTADKLHQRIVHEASSLRNTLDDFGLTESPGILTLTLRHGNISVPNTPEGQQLIERLFRYAQSIENGND